MDLPRESIINTQQQRKFNFGMLRSYQHRCQSWRMFMKVMKQGKAWVRTFSWTETETQVKNF